MPSPHDLDAYLRSHASAAVAGPIRAIARTAATLSRRIARGSLGERLGATVGENADGDAQKALDVIADNAFAQALGTAGVRWLASEERADVVELDRNGTLAVAIDPLDGSSNIDVNVSIGTIFSIRTARTGGLDSFLRPGREQLAAGYVLYGPQCTLVLTVGAGVATFLLDPDSRRFHGVAENGRIAAETAEFAVNASNALHWPQPVRAYVNDCIAGADGPLRKAFNMRWVGSLVVEAHRILTRGGVFLYPGDARPGYGRGRLRMVYECAAIALVVEAAEGAATEGRVPILDLTPDTLHARAPLVFGSIEEVVRVAAYHDRPGRCASPLFGQRGLFSAGAAS